MGTDLGTTRERLRVSNLRVNWQLRAVLPVAAVLLNGLLLFVLVTLSLGDPERNTVLVVATAGAVCVCAAMLMVLGVVFRRPMAELQDKIAQVRAGSMDVAVSFADRNDEVGDLGRDFNMMVQQLRESREEIQHLHRTQISRAEHLATLGELAAGLAHEIRNPLAGIAGVIEIIGRDLPKESPARLVLKDVRAEVLHINRIVSDLLEIARPKAPEFRPGDINATAEHAVLFAREQAHTKGVELELIRSEGLPPLDHDAGQIHQVLLNLILNAIQACDANGRVRIEITSTDKLVCVAVDDTGKGIPPEILPNIFRPFFTTKGNGTGLGLSLARRIVEDHGGRIDVTSWLGKGSNFVVVLPQQRSTIEVGS
ncbi:MAG TPA: ATP-binding protein [Clostridia bacterium]|nr:ATP-binding protein [Clostridia bacterium]